MTIHKFMINPGLMKTIIPAVGCTFNKPLQAGLDPTGLPVIWCEVFTNMSVGYVPMTVMCVGTGQPVPADYTYLNTFVQDVYVWHVYYKL
jgi:hypothetical protein